ncbi:MAG: tyrosine-type recombinase/integrase [Bacteroidia bacterium]
MKGLPIYNEEYVKLLDEFTVAVSAQGYSAGREPIYPTMIREFLFFCENKAIESISDIKARDVLDYLDYLRERPNQCRAGGLSDSVLRQQQYSLRLFFDHFVETGLLLSSPVHLPKFGAFKYNERKPLSVEEVAVIKKHCRGYADKAILALAYGCGLRRTEIERLNIGDVLLNGGMLTVRKGKYSKSRTIGLSDNIIRDLRAYVVYERTSIAQRFNTNNKAFLLNRIGGRLMGQDIHTRLKRLVKSTGDKNLITKQVCLHVLRHSIATHLLDNGAGIEFVKEFLGHEELDTTHLYTKRRKRQKLIQRSSDEFFRNNNSNNNTEKTW